MWIWWLNVVVPLRWARVEELRIIEIKYKCETIFLYIDYSHHLSGYNKYYCYHVMDAGERVYWNNVTNCRPRDFTKHNCSVFKNKAKSSSTHLELYKDITLLGSKKRHEAVVGAHWLFNSAPEYNCPLHILPPADHHLFSHRCQQDRLLPRRCSLDDCGPTKWPCCRGREQSRLKGQCQPGFRWSIWWELTWRSDALMRTL